MVPLRVPPVFHLTAPTLETVLNRINSEPDLGSGSALACLIVFIQFQWEYREEPYSNMALSCLKNVFLNVLLSKGDLGGH